MQEAKSGIPSSCQPHSEQMKGKQRETLVPQQQGVYDSRAHHDKSQNAPGVIFFVGGGFPQETKIQDFVVIVSCAVCVPQKHCNQYYQMYFKTRMWLSKIAQLKLMKEY